MRSPFMTFQRNIIILTTIFLILGISFSIIPQASAYGPSRNTFTMEQPATYPTLNSITNNPDLGDERNFFRVRQTGDTEWKDIIKLEPNKEYEARVIIHNSSADNLNLSAKDIRLSINMPNRENAYVTEAEVNAYLTGSNITPSKIWDNIVLKSDQRFHVAIISAQYYTNFSTEKDGGFKLGNDLFSRIGTPLGYDKLDGTIGTADKDSGYALIRFKAVMKSKIMTWFENNILNKLSTSMTGSAADDWSNTSNDI
ncbi:hypothetical protein [Bifidobacterium callimiconis]|uniref:Uncharacterized protein n=1 Tax=Bifidobacterium callimiconis TaxID=2306973 RepID=A0A430FBI4_9BIFI|nr:hypothetical protein [Bifidobacterium callimiconis]RSX50206.1 hypothetical protein D2E23_1754 [Bifidobacterium callimiconis]